MENQAPRHYTSAQFFALISIDQYGRIRREVSPSIIHSRDTILSPHVTADFLKAVAHSNEIGLRMPYQENASIQPLVHHSMSYDSYNSRFPDDVKYEESMVPTANGYHVNPTLWPGRGLASLPILKDELLHNRRPYSQTYGLRPQEAIISTKNANLLRRCYEKVFQNIQQSNCRVLAKVYVKLVEPHKQVKYPYNGRKAVAGVVQKLTPEESKPPWWPIGVRHREPDHLLKAERIALLLHILCDLHYSHGITSQRLKNAEQSVRSQITPVECLRLLDELYRVRGEEEKLLSGFLRKDSTVLISQINLPADYQTSSK